MGTKGGFDGKLYRNTGTYSVPVWSEITVVRDLTHDAPRDEHDDSDRGSAEHTYYPGRVDRSLNIQVRYNPDDAEFLALESAAISKTVLDLAVADGAIATTGTKYFRADWLVFGNSNPQPLGDIMVVDYVLRRANTTNTPGYVTVGSS